MKAKNFSKILICDFGKSLHTDHYLSALCDLSFQHEIQIFPDYEKHKSPTLLLDAATKLNCDKILVITGEKVLTLDFLRIFNRFRNSHIAIYLFYFNYHKFHAISLKTCAFMFFLRLSCVYKLYVSDPRINYFSAYRLSSKFNYICDFHDLLTRSKSIFSSINFEISQVTNYKNNKSINVSFLGRLNNKKGLNLLLRALVANKRLLIENNISFNFKGLMSNVDSQRHKPSIEILEQDRIATFDFRFIENLEFIQALESSDFCWCVQPNFHASSGVFTQAVALNSVPIVATGSTLDFICKSHKFGLSINTDGKRFNHEFPVLISSILNYNFSTQNSQQNMYDYTLRNSKDAFINQLESSL